MPRADSDIRDWSSNWESPSTNNQMCMFPFLKSARIPLQISYVNSFYSSTSTGINQNNYTGSKLHEIAFDGCMCFNVLDPSTFYI